MSVVAVDSAALVIDTLYANFPQTTIENLCDQNGKELPLKGVFFKDDAEARKFHSPSRLVVLHSKGENYFFQTIEDAIDQAVTAYRAIRAMGGEKIEMRFSFDKGYYVNFSTKLDTQARKLAFANDTIIPSYGFCFPYDSVSSGEGLGNRIICSNLITTKTVANFSFAVRHTKNMGEKMIDIENGIAAIAQNWSKFIDYCDTMGRKKIDPRAFYASLYGSKPESGRGLTVWQKRYEKIDQRLQSEAYKLGISPDNGWMVFNSIQGYLQHDTTRKNEDFLVRAQQANGSPILAKAESLILGA